MLAMFLVVSAIAANAADGDKINVSSLQAVTMEALDQGYWDGTHGYEIATDKKTHHYLVITVHFTVALGEKTRELELTEDNVQLLDTKKRNYKVLALYYDDFTYGGDLYRDLEFHKRDQGKKFRLHLAFRVLKDSGACTLRLGSYFSKSGITAKPGQPKRQPFAGLADFTIESMKVIDRIKMRESYKARINGKRVCLIRHYHAAAGAKLVAVAAKVQPKHARSTVDFETFDLPSITINDGRTDGFYVTDATLSDGEYEDGDGTQITKKGDVWPSQTFILVFSVPDKAKTFQFRVRDEVIAKGELQ